MGNNYLKPNNLIKQLASEQPNIRCSRPKVRATWITSYKRINKKIKINVQISNKIMKKNLNQLQLLEFYSDYQWKRDMRYARNVSPLSPSLCPTLIRIRSCSILVSTSQLAFTPTDITADLFHSYGRHLIGCPLTPARVSNCRLNLSISLLTVSTSRMIRYNIRQTIMHDLNLCNRSYQRKPSDHGYATLGEVRANLKQTEVRARCLK